MPHRRSVAALVALCAIGAGVRAARADEPDDPADDRLIPIEEPRDRHWVRALGEAGLLIGIFEAQYWYNKELNKFDFEYNADWRNFKARFVTLEAWSLDDNYYETNAWRHPVQGAMNYLFARSNGFSSLESYFFSEAASTVWELFGEYKEEVSINDVVITPRSGSVVGESLWQMGTFFRRGSPNLVNQIVANLFGAGKPLFDRWDHKRRLRPHTGPLGFDDSVTHRFDAFVLGGSQSAPGGSQSFLRTGLETELILIPGFARDGRAKKLYVDPVYSTMRLSWTWGDRTFIDYDVFARTALSTWHRKHLCPTSGYNLLFGLSGAYHYNNHVSEGRTIRSKMDRVSIGHVLGPTVDLTLRSGELDLRGVVDVYADWAFVRNFAMDTLREAEPDVPVRSTIDRDNYYHAIGATGRVQLTAAWRGFGLGVAYAGDRFRSVQGVDRHQQELVQDYGLYDQRDEARAWGRGRIGLGRGMAVELELGVEYRRRAGQAKTAVEEESERRVVGGARFTL